MEVADTSLAIDLGAKLSDYERVGVREYIVVGLSTQEVYWYVRRGDRLERIATDPDGLYRSGAFPGLWLDPAVQDDPTYAEHWAGHRPVTVTVEPDRIVISRAGEDAGENGDEED